LLALLYDEGKEAARPEGAADESVGVKEEEPGPEVAGAGCGPTGVAEGAVGMMREGPGEREVQARRQGRYRATERAVEGDIVYVRN